MNIDFLDYRTLPGQNPLFLDYLYRLDAVKDYYGDAHQSLENLVARCRDLLAQGRDYPRSEMARILSAFNRQAGSGEKALANIERLKAPDSVAIVTGQQLGLFGGPAFCFYKAATAVRLAQLLEQEGIPAVPVFWLPSDDSDFDEVRSSYWLDQGGNRLAVEFSQGGFPSERMVGTIDTAQAPALLDGLKDKGLGPFAEEALERLAQTYRPGSDFRGCFARWLAEIFRDFGLVLFDSLSPGYKPLAQEAFRVARQDRKEIVEALLRRNCELEMSGYRPQVRSDDNETLLFWVNGQCRYKLVFREGVYRAKSEIIGEPSCLEDCPDRLGPNVLLRPIVQDHLFPTAAYVGGPSEIAYFSQVSAIAHRWGIRPVVVPRAGVTVIDRKAQRYMRQHQLEFGDLAAGSRLDINRRLAQGGSSGDVLSRFESWKTEVERRGAELDALMGEEDPQAAGMLRNALPKMLYQLNKVQERYVKNHEKRNEALGRHLDYLYSRLLPEASLQERAVNFNQLLAQEGDGLIREIIESIDPFARAHQLIYL